MQVFKVILILFLFNVIVNGQAITVFSGTPEIKISESGIDRIINKIDIEKSNMLRCVISEIDDKYYWASRENKELVKINSGAFITFAALDGSGTIRIINPKLKDAASMMSQTEKKYDYVETMFIGLCILTYYGQN